MDIKTIAMLKKYIDKVVETGGGIAPSEVMRLQRIVEELQASYEDIDMAISKKVDAEDGKGLSSNDFTDEYLDKLNKLSESDGEVDSIQINNKELPVVNGAVNIPIADDGVFGVVTSSNETDKITILKDGTMRINSISFNKIVQSEDDGSESNAIIFSGGNSGA